jgi:hypothetical protein
MKTTAAHYLKGLSDYVRSIMLERWSCEERIAGCRSNIVMPARVFGVFKTR